VEQSLLSSESRGLLAKACHTFGVPGYEMGRQLILHIGRHKTGTTSLQKFLSLNDRVLLDQHDILYPTSGRRGHYHHPVFWSVINDNNAIDSEVTVRVTDEAKEHNAKTVILSSEILSRPSVTKDQLRVIKNEFQIFDISILVFLREQHDFLESVYAERIKKGLLCYPNNIYTIDKELNYYTFIKKYADVFGNDNIIVLTYKNNPEHSIFNDFLNALGCTSNNRFIFPRRKNVRLPWMYIEILRILNSKKRVREKLTANKMKKIMKVANKIIPGIIDRPRPLSIKERSDIMDSYEETNNMLAREYLGRDNLF
jgi:hypothetical protein